ncbi:PucR family transcriptional regulator [Kutzneria viridogrisea]|uniref:PucR family transcriptional regulator n=1 Tax=Kutzneria viridogrisea TaxID=47990 RepID=A0ABR6BP13_9PSEU|nr:hypothetical protein [Kutzneria viridogrisea]
MALSELSVPLRTLLAQPELRLHLVSGQEAVDRPVRWAHVSELREPAPYLLGGELLLTVGLDLPQDLDRYVRSLVRAQVSALGLGLTPVHEQVPPALAQACAKHGLPLLTVPEATPFLAVSQAVGAALAEAQHAELRWLTGTQAALTKAAARANPAQAVLRVLAEVLSCWATLLDGTDAVLAQVGRVGAVDAELLDLARRVREGSGPRAASTEIGRTHVVAHPVDPAAVLLVGVPRAVTATDRAVLAVVQALLGLAGREHGRLATRVLLGDGRYRVLRGRRVGPGDPALDTPFVEITGNELRAVLPEDSVPDLPALHASGWLTALSLPHPVATLAAADREASRLLERVRATGRPARADADLVGLIDPHAARALLTPLDGRPALVDTLRTWLVHNGNWDRTATALGLHRNSVRHRIAQVEKALEVDLSDVQRRVELWLALTALPAR